MSELSTNLSVDQLLWDKILATKTGRQIGRDRTILTNAPISRWFSYGGMTESGKSTLKASHKQPGERLARLGILVPSINAEVVTANIYSHYHATDQTPPMQETRQITMHDGLIKGFNLRSYTGVRYAEIEKDVALASKWTEVDPMQSTTEALLGTVELLDSAPGFNPHLVQA